MSALQELGMLEGMRPKQLGKKHKQRHSSSSIIAASSNSTASRTAPALAKGSDCPIIIMLLFCRQVLD